MIDFKKTKFVRFGRTSVQICATRIHEAVIHGAFHIDETN